MQRTVIQLLASAVACALLGSAGASNVFKWVDADGITHYSDAAPEAVETTQIDLPEPNLASSAGSAADSDYYSISNQWERMNRERLEREKLEVERARIRAEQKASEPRTVYLRQSDEVRYVPVYRGFGFRKHRRHIHYRHRIPGPGINIQQPLRSLGGTPSIQ